MQFLAVYLNHNLQRNQQLRQLEKNLNNFVYGWHVQEICKITFWSTSLAFEILCRIVILILHQNCCPMVCNMIIFLERQTQTKFQNGHRENCVNQCTVWTGFKHDGWRFCHGWNKNTGSLFKLASNFDHGLNLNTFMTIMIGGNVILSNQMECPTDLVKLMEVVLTSNEPYGYSTCWRLRKSTMITCSDVTWNIFLQNRLFLRNLFILNILVIRFDQNYSYTRMLTRISMSARKSAQLQH